MIWLAIQKLRVRLLIFTIKITDLSWAHEDIIKSKYSQAQWCRGRDRQLSLSSRLAEAIGRLCLKTN